MRYIVLIIFSCVVPPDDEFVSSLSHTHELIQREIVFLGGETESPESLIFVAFRGERFRPRHFEMLSHLDDLKWFSCRDVTGTPESLAYLRALPHLERLDIRNSPEVGRGVERLSEFPALREIWLEDVALSDEGALALAKLPKIRELHLEDVKLTDAGAVALEALASRGVKCDFIGLEGLSAGVATKLYEKAGPHYK